jgi:hypothetical protein
MRRWVEAVERKIEQLSTDWGRSRSDWPFEGSLSG